LANEYPGVENTSYPGADVTPLELIQRAKVQPEVSVDQIVCVPGPELKALLRGGRPVRLSDLMAHPDQRPESRRFRYGHVLGAGVSSAAIAEWQERHRHIVLSSDMISLLVKVDGIHLWANLETGRAYFGILPLAEWRSVREHEAALLFEDFPETTLVISYHDNGDYYLLLHTAENRFIWFDPQSIDPNDWEFIDGAVDEFLEWWWQRTQELNPSFEPEDTTQSPTRT
jgi:hypothetical protein